MFTFVKDRHIRTFLLKTMRAFCAVFPKLFKCRRKCIAADFPAFCILQYVLAIFWKFPTLGFERHCDEHYVSKLWEKCGSSLPPRSYRPHRRGSLALRWRSSGLWRMMLLKTNGRKDNGNYMGKHLMRNGRNAVKIRRSVRNIAEKTIGRLLVRSLKYCFKEDLRIESFHGGRIIFIPRKSKTYFIRRIFLSKTQKARVSGKIWILDI